MSEGPRTSEQSPVTVEAIVAGELGGDDIRPDGEMLRRQAAVAAESGNEQLAENLRRGAELAAFDDASLLRFYDALRPGRSTAAELDDLAGELKRSGALNCAELVREASAAYRRRGLVD